MSLLVWRLVLMIFELEVLKAIESHVDVSAEIRTFFTALVSDWNVDRANMCKKLMGQHRLLVMVTGYTRENSLTSKNTHSSCRVGIGTNMNQDCHAVRTSIPWHRRLHHVMA